VIKVTIFRRQDIAIALLSAFQSLISMIPMTKAVFLIEKMAISFFSNTYVYEN